MDKLSRFLLYVFGAGLFLLALFGVYEYALLKEAHSALARGK
jgi:hypothetical protein